MPLSGCECQASKSVNSDAHPRPTPQGLAVGAWPWPEAQAEPTAPPPWMSTLDGIGRVGRQKLFEAGYSTVEIGLRRIIALYHRSSTSRQIR